uniref:THAP domain-containing protein 1 n=1 Tax=Gadus morhua TaxID=8049 RepID=A0A8C4ZY95_GADMO
MSDIGRRTVGSFCIAPGCSNEFYRLKESGGIVHFHVIPVKKPEVLRRWLAALKRLSPPMGPGQRVCSDHFIEADYIEEGKVQNITPSLNITPPLKTVTSFSRCTSCYSLQH